MKDTTKPDDLKASIESMQPVAERDAKAGDKPQAELEFVVRMSNDANRALHYISDVRATRYDPVSRTLVLALSDEGRQVIPGAISKLPVFRRIDPGSIAEIRLQVPDKLIKLSRNAPPGELAFETHQLSDAREVVVEIGWADVPYYKDTRAQKDDMRLPAARWEQHKARATRVLKGGGGRKSKG
jgi:hypothetical protein